MKTFKHLIARTTKSIMTLAMVLLIAGNVTLSAQEKESVFKADPEVGFIWGIELKSAFIQEELSTQLGMYAGALFNHAVMVGIVGAANVTHPTINYGYTGMVVQYIFKPGRMVHLTPQVTLGSGSTKDYETEKSSLLDNFGNVTGEYFSFVEPGITIELNLGVKTRLVLGAGYRFVSGIDQNNEHIAKTHVSNGDLSCFNIMAGVKFGLY